MTDVLPRCAGRNPLEASVVHHAGFDERAESGTAHPAFLRRFRVAAISASRCRSSWNSCAPISPRLRSRPRVLDAFPHQLSGGMRQRVAIALATVCRPDFIIADEPTTALDVIVQNSVLTMIREVQRELGSSLIFVTHDMAVHANLSHRLGIMYAGRLGGGGQDGRCLSQAAASVYGASHCQPCRASGTIAASRAGRRAAESRRSAGRLPLSSALSARDGHLPAGKPAHDRTCPPGHRVACFAAAPESSAVSTPLLEVSQVGRSYSMGRLLSRHRVRAVDGISFDHAVGANPRSWPSSASRGAARRRWRE